MEFQELEQRIDEIQNKLLAARDSAEAGLELIDKLLRDLMRERVTHKELSSPK